MNRFIIGMLVTVSFSANVFAQGVQATGNIVGATPAQVQYEVVNDPVTTQSVVTNVEQAPVVIQNQPNVQVQRQATTIVEDSPLSESTADRLRRQRINLEQKVESKIVEKLEQDRMESERQRLDSMFGESSAPVVQKNIEVNQQVFEQAQVVAPAVIAPVQVVTPTPAVGPVVEQQLNMAPAQVEVKSELAAVAIKKKNSNRMTVGADLGFLSYDVENMQTAGSLGFSVGLETEDRLILEGSFRYSRSEIEASNRFAFCTVGYAGSECFATVTEMDQYNYNGSVKYRFLSGMFSPFLGGILSYTYRSYEDVQYFDYQLSASSTAVDAGIVVGADVRITNNFKISGEYVYMANMMYNISYDNELEPSKILGDQNDDKIEEIGYSTFMFSLKYMF